MNSGMVRIKICCIRGLEEARSAIAAGADAVGLVGQMPSGPGVIPDEIIASIAGMIPPPVATFLLTSEQTAAGIISHHRRTRTSVIQLVDSVSPVVLGAVRGSLPGVKLVQVIHVVDQDSIARARFIGAFVDALLLDSGRPDIPVKELGGTGRTHNWSLSAAIRLSVSIPVFLAGGLRPDNVADAIRTVEPFAVDVCSGVRTDGRLDLRKVREFFRAVRASTRGEYEGFHDEH